jgi:hypothetical protein
MKSNKHLDEQIRNALENLEGTYDPNAWDLFEKHLDAAAPHEGEWVDELLISRLSTLETPLPPNSWDLMEERIEAEETAEILENEAIIDNLAYDKLHRFEAPFQYSHWQLMAQRLEAEFTLRYTLYKYKAAEASLMVLLLLAIVRFLPVMDGYFYPQDSNPAPAGLPLKMFDVPVSPSAEKIENEKHSPPFYSQKPGKPSNNSNLSNAGKTQSSGDNHTSFLLKNLPVLPLAILGKHAEVNRLEVSGSSISVRADDANLLAMNELGEVNSVFVPALILPDATPFHGGKELRFSIFASGNYSYVFTPAERLTVVDTLISTDSDTTAASGYGGGILVSFKRNRWELQTGGVYSFRRYEPNTPVVLFETVRYYIKEDFKGIQMDMLETPFNLLYHFKNTGNWRMYGLGGASFHFITSAEYDIRRTKYDSFSLIQIPSSPDDESRTVLKKQKQFNDGVFEGGKLGDNIYLSANLGFGVERYVSPRWCLFFQSDYRHSLTSKGLGPNMDRFNTFSMSLGAKVSLK